MKSKLVACLLAGAMLVGTVPVTALAEEITLHETTDEEEAEETSTEAEAAVDLFRGMMPLTENVQQLYEVLKGEMERIAEEGGSTEVRIDNLDLIYHSSDTSIDSQLRSDAGEALYWIGRTAPEVIYWNQTREDGRLRIVENQGDYIDEAKQTYQITSVTISLPVGVEYRVDNQPYVMTTDTTAYQRAIQNAEAVIREAASLSDWEKLEYYKDYICRVAEEDEAIQTALFEEGSIFVIANFPSSTWEVLSVFDEDPATKSDSEAYARAFRYLCSHSTFSDPEFDCYIMSGGSVSDQEDRSVFSTWNQVYLDGTMYLVDLAKNDSSDLKEKDAFFMVSKQEASRWNGYDIDVNGETISYNTDLGIVMRYEAWVLQLGADTKPADPKEQTISRLQEVVSNLQETLTELEGDRDTEEQRVAELKAQVAALEKQLDELQKQDAADEKSVQMLRLYNPNSGEHFYTANAAERDYLVKRGWKFEGVGWNAPKKSNTPVYRLYNPNAGDHHYTTSVTERNMLLKAGWNDEQIGWYAVDKDKQADAVPVYRQYNPNAKKAGSHNFTKSQGEAKHLVSVGWRDEGVAWYGVKQ